MTDPRTIIQQILERGRSEDIFFSEKQHGDGIALFHAGDDPFHVFAVNATNKAHLVRIYEIRSANQSAPDASHPSDRISDLVTLIKDEDREDVLYFVAACTQEHAYTFLLDIEQKKFVWKHSGESPYGTDDRSIGSTFLRCGAKRAG